MEVLFVSHKYPPATGGMEKQSYELIRGMERHATVHRIVYDGTGSLLWFFITLSRRIRTLCREHPGIGAIHFNDGLMAAFCSFHRSYRHLPQTATLHGLDVVFPSALYRRYILPRFHRFARLFAVSEATAQQAIARGIAAEKITIIRNGADTESAPSPMDLSEKPLANSPTQPYLVMMGRPVQRKGFSWFTEHVLPRLDSRYQVVIIGPYQARPTRWERVLYNAVPRIWRTKIMLFLGYPSDTIALRKLIAVHANRVRHLGRLPRSEADAIIRGAAAFLMPNIAVEGDMEGFGLVCLEAAMQETLVFAANIEGIPDAIQNGKNGYLLPSGDATAWAAALNDLLDTDVDTVTRMERQFRKYTVSNYGWEHMVTAYADELAKVVGSHVSLGNNTPAS